MKLINFIFCLVDTLIDNNPLPDSKENTHSNIKNFNLI